MKKADSASVIHIDISTQLEELRAQIAARPRLNFIHIDHASLNDAEDQNIIMLARKNIETKAKLVEMVNAGYHLYVLRDGVSSLVRHRRIPTLWRNVISGEVQVDSNGIYHAVAPAAGAGEPRLLVVFSSVAGKMYTPSLMRHFEQNFASIGKFIPQNTHIMRIADFGGVVGAFYLNTNALPQNEEHIHSRIAATARELGVAEENIVLYGTSKGGTAAAFYAMRHGWRGIAVDPILSDEHYIYVHRDLHFTQGTFPAPKEARFAQLVQAVHPQARLSVVCSTRSPQFPYIESTLIDRFRERFLFLNSENSSINTHPDVGPQTVPHALAQINRHLAGLDAPGGMQTVW